SNWRGSSNRSKRFASTACDSMSRASLGAPALESPRRWRGWRAHGMASDWLRKSFGPVVRFFMRRWVRHEEIIRIRQQLRYLALAEILVRTEPRAADLTPFELSLFSQNGEDGVLIEIMRRIGTRQG